MRHIGAVDILDTGPEGPLFHRCLSTSWRGVSRRRGAVRWSGLWSFACPVPATYVAG